MPSAANSYRCVNIDAATRVDGLDSTPFHVIRYSATGKEGQGQGRVKNTSSEKLLRIPLPSARPPRYGGIAQSPLFHHATLYGCSAPHSSLGGFNCALGRWLGWLELVGVGWGESHSRGVGSWYRPPSYCGTYYALWVPSAGNVSLPTQVGMTPSHAKCRSFVAGGFSFVIAWE